MKTKFIPCSVCDGKGFVYWTNNTDPANSAGSKPCPRCLGITHIEVPFTNADRIRAMRDEELANFLHNVVRKFMCEYCKEYERIKAAKGHAKCNGECDKAYLEWLKQPAE